MVQMDQAKEGLLEIQNSSNRNVHTESGSNDTLVSILGQLVQSKNNASNGNNNCNDENSSSIMSPVTVVSKQKTVTFSCQWNPFPEAIVIDGKSLTLQSTMKEILTHSDEGDESFSDDHELNLNDEKKNYTFR